MEILTETIIPSVVSIVGFVITILTTRRQFENLKKERIAERQSGLYLECYKKIEAIINSPSLIFDGNYFDSVLIFKAEMKLNASNSTLRAYKNYLNYIHSFLEKYNDFYLQNDPRTNRNNIETIIDEETGTLDETLHISPNDLLDFNLLLEDYRNKNCPSMKEVKEKILKILNAMRNDLSNGSAEKDIIE